MSIGDNGFPRPILPPGGADPTAPKVHMAQAVDLAALAARRRNRHVWTVIARHLVLDDSLIDRLATAQAKFEAALATGAPPPENVQIPMSQDSLFAIDGPGCMKCGIHWSVGWKDGCPVSDEEFERGTGQQIPRRGDQVVVASADPDEEEVEWIDSTDLTEEEKHEVEELSKGLHVVQRRIKAVDEA